MHSKWQPSSLPSGTTSYALLSCEFLSGQYQGKGLKCRQFHFSSSLERLWSFFTTGINHNRTCIFLVCSRCCCGWMTKSLCRSTCLGPVDAVLSLGTERHVLGSAYDAANTTNPIIPVKTMSFLSRSHLKLFATVGYCTLLHGGKKTQYSF